MDPLPIARKLPFYYGWVVVAVAFVTLAIGVNSRTAFSLLYPYILDEFQWNRGDTAAIFSIGFFASTFIAPLIGKLMDQFGPRLVMPLGATIVALGFIAATYVSTIWGMYLSLGLGVVGGSIFISYIGHSLFLPQWFERRRGLAVGIAFSGVGIGAIILMPLVQQIITEFGWRAACQTLALLLFVLLVPLNLLWQRRRPADIGLRPDGLSEREHQDRHRDKRGLTVVDKHWAEKPWTLKQAMATGRFWWLVLGFMAFLHSWYAVQVHQTKYLIELGFAAVDAAFALGLVGLASIGGQIFIGYLSDRVGRELAWTIGLVGFIISYIMLLTLPAYPSLMLVYLMAIIQGFLGNGLASVYAAIPADIFQGRHYGSIFGVLGLASGVGAGMGPWISGLLYDLQGDYVDAYLLAIGLCLVSMVAIWMASPRKIRRVAG